jgi:hypothetical protein
MSGKFLPVIGQDQLRTDYSDINRAYLERLRASEERAAKKSAVGAGGGAGAGDADDEGEEDVDADEAPGGGRGGVKFAGPQMLKSLKVRKTPELSGMADRITRQDHVCRVLAKGNVDVWRAQMLLGLGHWTNDAPTEHKHCSAGCWFRSTFPASYTGASGGAGGAVEVAEDTLPGHLRSTKSEVSEFRIVREPAAIKYVSP